MISVNGVFRKQLHFFVSNTNPLGTTLITEIEYFFDTDPGYGNGTSIDVAEFESSGRNFHIYYQWPECGDAFITYPRIG